MKWLTYEDLLKQNTILSFEQTVEACMKNKEFMKEYDRLNGTNLTNRYSVFENFIDKVTGKRKEELYQFFDDVRELVYKPALANTLKNHTK